MANYPVRPQDHRKGRRGRPNPLDDPTFASAVAEMFATGASRAEMCTIFNVKDKDTITKWRRDPRVKAIIWKLTEDRILQVTRKVDAVITNRLEKAENMTVQELLAIRKEFLGGSLRDKTQNIDEDTVNEAHALLERDPGMIEKLNEIFSGE